MKRLGRAVLLAAAAVTLAACGVVEVREGGPLSFGERMRLGSIYESRGEYELALREYEGAQEIDTKEAAAYFALGNVYLRMKDYDRAESHYLRAIELRPEPDFYNNLGWLYMEKGDLALAREALGHAAGSTEGARGYVYLDTMGVLETRSGEYDKAEESFLAAARAVPEGGRDALFQIYTHLLELYKASGKKDEAAILEEKLGLFKARSDEKKGGL